MSASNTSKNILIIMTGSIAAYKACNVISALAKEGHNLQVVMTEASKNFVGPATIEGLTGKAPLSNTFAPGNAMDHINLQRWADIIAVIPATANFLNKLAAGIGDDLAATLFLAHDFQKPFLIFPAMNTKMYSHPITQKSIATLKNIGIHISKTEEGDLACGEVGEGRLPEPEYILSEIKKYFVTKKKIKILITAGGTSVPIDDVRSITNKSTGKTASFLAQHFIDEAYDVTYLHSTNAMLPIGDFNKYSFETFDDLQNQMKFLLSKHKFDFVFHAAAVSDYSANTTLGKINSNADFIQLNMTKNPKLIELVKKISPNSVLFGFKLTSTSLQSEILKKVEKLFTAADCDYIIQNDWNDIKGGRHKFNFFNKRHFSDFVEKEDIAELTKAVSTIVENHERNIL